jgi:hypothetical protein
MWATPHASEHNGLDTTRFIACPNTGRRHLDDARERSTSGGVLKEITAKNDGATNVSVRLAYKGSDLEKQTVSSKLSGTVSTG